MPIGGRFITNIQNVEKNLKRKFNTFNENIEILDDTKKELETAINELKVEIDNYTSQSNENEKNHELHQTYTSTLKSLKKDHNFLTEQLLTLEQLKHQNQKLYNQLEVLTAIKDTELQSRLNDFKQLIDAYSHDTQLKNFIILFTFRKFINNNAAEAINLLIPYIKDFKLNDINFRDEVGKTILFYAVQAGNAQLVKDLIYKGANVNICAVAGYSPLHLAVFSQQMEITKILLNNGADSEITNIKGETPLMRILGLTQIMQAIKWIELGLSYKGITVEGKNILHTIMRASGFTFEDGFTLIVNESVGVLDFKRIEKLCDKLTEIVDLKSLDTPDVFGNYPLHYACSNSDKETVEYLLNKGFNLSSLNVYNESYLHFAVGGGKQDIIKFLLNKGLDINSRDINGLTPFYLACKVKNKEVAQYILDNFNPDLDLVDNYGYNGLL